MKRLIILLLACLLSGSCALDYIVPAPPASRGLQPRPYPLRPKRPPVVLASLDAFWVEG